MEALEQVIQLYVSLLSNPWRTLSSLQKRMLQVKNAKLTHQGFPSFRAVNQRIEKDATGAQKGLAQVNVFSGIQGGRNAFERMSLKFS